MSENVKNLQAKQVTEVEKQLLDLEREFLDLRLSKSVQQVKDHSKFKKIKAEISRLKLKMSQTR